MMRPETTEDFDAALVGLTVEQKLDLILAQLARLEPLMSLIENPPAMLAAMVPGLDGLGDD